MNSTATARAIELGHVHHSTSDRRARIEFLIVGVLRQAFADAGTREFNLVAVGDVARSDAGDLDYARSLCERAGGRLVDADDALSVSAASKTALLLDGARADLLPLGDLYVSQVIELAGGASLPPHAAELAELCRGAETLDRALFRLFDERRDFHSATAGLEPAVREALRHRLAAARFRRIRVGLVPKLGARTLGIDLYA